MSDFAVKITVRNNRMLKAIRARGYKSIKEFCQQSGVNYQATIRALGFRSRVMDSGEWNKFAYDLSAALHCEPEDLWPEHLKNLHARKNSVEFSASEIDLRNLVVPEKSSIDVKCLYEFVAQLPPRKGFVLAHRFGLIDGEYSFGELAEILGVSEQRVKAIQQEGMRIIRRRFRNKGIKEFAALLIDESPLARVESVMG